MQPALAALDPDIAYPNRKPQFAAVFDPRWAISYYHGCGGGPYAEQPYVSRGVVPPMVQTGSAPGFAPRADGWSIAAPTAAAFGSYGTTGAGITWAPNQTAGTHIVVFRALADAGADSSTRVFTFYGDASANVGSFLCQVTGTTLQVGWRNPFPGWASATRTGLWKAGDLVVLVCTYVGSSSILYVNGVQVATGNGTPNNTIGNSSAELSIAGKLNMPGGGTASTGCDWPILHAVWSDRAFSPGEVQWVTENPLNWPFLPGPITAALPSHGPVFYTVTPSDTVASGDGLTFATAPVQVDTESPTDATIFATAPVQADSQVAGDGLIFATAPAPADTQATADTQAFSTAPAFADTCTPTDVCLAGLLYIIGVADTQATADALIFSTAPVQADAQPQVDMPAFSTAQGYSDTAASTDSIATQRAVAQILADAVVSTDATVTTLLLVNFRWKPVGQLKPDMAALVTYQQPAATVTYASLQANMTALSPVATAPAVASTDTGSLADAAAVTDTISIVMS